MSIKRGATAMLLGLAVAGQSAPPPPSAPRAGDGSASLNERMTGDLTPVHDPVIIRAGETYYLFNTVSAENEPPGLLHIRTSKDLVSWKKVGAVFPSLPAWAKKAVPGTKGLWAPDISFVGGQYRVYYSVSTFGSNRSSMGLATSPTLDPSAPKYKWTDQGEVFSSRATDDYNAIDPNLVIDRQGNQWLAFGSFWSGLKMIRLDPATGKPAPGDRNVIGIARRTSPGAIEAPFIISRGDYYYLFASNDSCCRGADSTYYTIVGRAREVTGPYVDAKGRKMMDGAGEVVLHARLDKTRRWAGPGHPAVLMQGDRAIIVYHAYDAKNGGRPTLRIQPLGWDKDGWPVAL